ncbi:MAG: hypothetical protein ABIL58_06030 [Pseudomonadota bacterium]
MTPLVRGTLVALLAVVCGCATLFRPAGVSPEAAALLARAGDINPGLMTLKGLGSLDIVRSGKRFQARVAWICQPPDKFRITVLGALGRPAISLVSDGRRFSFLSHDTGQFEQWDRGALFPPVPLPIAIAPEDIADVLSGRVPVKAYDAASVKPGDTTAIEVLVLTQWGRTIQTIDFRKGSPRPEDFTVYTEQGERAYAVAFRDHREMAGFRLPGRFEIRGSDGSSVSVRADRYWPNAPVDPAVFVLKPA